MHSGVKLCKNKNANYQKKKRIFWIVYLYVKKMMIIHNLCDLFLIPPPPPPASHTRIGLINILYGMYEQINAII